MHRFSVCGVLSLIALLAGAAAIGFAAWILAGISAAPGPDGDFLAVGGALLLGTVGVAAVGFALTIAPADADGGGVLTVGRRQRQVSGAGLAVMVASLLVPFAVVHVATLVDALTVWLGLIGVGGALVGVAFVWTAGEAVLVRFDVVGRLRRASRRP